MIRPLDAAIEWTRRHRDLTLLAVLTLSFLVLAYGIRTNRDTATVAASQAKIAKNQAAAQKAQTAENTKLIATLFRQRDSRRHALDESRYKAALAGCARQNVARRGTNAIASILIDAFAPVIAAEQKGKVDTPLVHGLALAAGKLHVLTITKCKDVIPNPDAPAKAQHN